MVRCAVAGCPSLSKVGGVRPVGTYYFCFPKNPRKNQAWAKACNREDGFTPNPSSRVCQLHFGTGDFESLGGPGIRPRLRDGAVPASELPLPGEERQPQDEKPPSSKLGQTDLTESCDKEEEEDPDVAESTITDQEKTYFMNMVSSTGRLEYVYAEDQVHDSGGGDGGSSNGEYYNNPLTVGEDVKEHSYVTVGPKEDLTAEQKVALLGKQLQAAFSKNSMLIKKNVQLRSQLKKFKGVSGISGGGSVLKLSNRARLEVAKEILKPYFTPTQIDCFCRPDWLRSRNWAEEDFQLALNLRRLMSKRAFGFIRKKRLIPMPSLTSLRKYKRDRGLVGAGSPSASDKKKQRASQQVKASKVAGKRVSKAGNSKQQKKQQQQQHHVAAGNHVDSLTYLTLSRSAATQFEALTSSDPDLFQGHAVALLADEDGKTSLYFTPSNGRGSMDAADAAAAAGAMITVKVDSGAVEGADGAGHGKGRERVRGPDDHGEDEAADDGEEEEEEGQFITLPVITTEDGETVIQLSASDHQSLAAEGQEQGPTIQMVRVGPDGSYVIGSVKSS